MRALVINLDHAESRMDFQRWQLSRLGLEFIRLPAIAAHDAVIPNEETYWAGWQRPIASAERACLYSHRTAWEHVAKADAPFLIIEDDALLSDDVPAILAAAEGCRDIDLLQLETRRRQKILSRRAMAMGPVRAHRLLLDRAGAAGYVLWPSGAAKLLAAVARRPALADALIATPGLLHAYQVNPAGIIQNDMAIQEGLPPQWEVEASSVSSLSHRRVGKTAAQKRRRIAAQLSLGLRSLWGRLAHRKLFVPFPAERFTGRG